MADAGAYGSNWTDDELDLIVADYFDMLRREQAGEAYVKAEHNRRLQAKIDRTAGSIEFKHQNISAILVDLDIPRIHGYRPMVNAQNAIYGAVDRYLTQNPSALDIEGAVVVGLQEPQSLLLEQPPALQPVQEKPEALKRLIRKFDPVERDFRNRKLGLAGEKFVFESEIRRIAVQGNEKLSRQVRWVSQEDDSAGFDILSFDQNGKERLLEVKTTRGDKTRPFYITQNELRKADERPEHFRIYRLYEFSTAARMFEIAPPIENFVHLAPLSFRASFE